MDDVKEAAIVAGVAAAVLIGTTGAAWAADALLNTDLLSQIDPTLVGALSGATGGTVRAIRADQPTLRTLAVDGISGAGAGAFAWPFTLAMFGPVLGTLQTTTDIALTQGAKIGVGGMITGACLALVIGAAETVLGRFSRRGK